MTECPLLYSKSPNIQLSKLDYRWLSTGTSLQMYELAVMELVFSEIVEKHSAILENAKIVPLMFFVFQEGSVIGQVVKTKFTDYKTRAIYALEGYCVEKSDNVALWHNLPAVLEGERSLSDVWEKVRIDQKGIVSNEQARKINSQNIPEILPFTEKGMQSLIQQIRDAASPFSFAFGISSAAILAYHDFHLVAGIQDLTISNSSASFTGPSSQQMLSDLNSDNLSIDNLNYPPRQQWESYNPQKSHKDEGFVGNFKQMFRGLVSPNVDPEIDSSLNKIADILSRLTICEGRLKSNINETELTQWKNLVDQANMFFQNSVNNNNAYAFKDLEKLRELLKRELTRTRKSIDILSFTSSDIAHHSELLLDVLKKPNVRLRMILQGKSGNAFAEYPNAYRINHRKVDELTDRNKIFVELLSPKLSYQSTTKWYNGFLPLNVYIFDSTYYYISPQIWHNTQNVTYGFIEPGFSVVIEDYFERIYQQSDT